MTSNGRVARLTALALATGTLVAAGAGSAGAVNTDTTTFDATGGGSVIRLTVNLPSQLAPVTSAVGLPQSLTQDLVLTGGAVRTGALAEAIATSTLGANGNVPVLSGLLDESVTAEYGKNASANSSLLPADVKAGLAQLGIHVNLLDLNSNVLNPNVDGVVSSSQSTVAGLVIDGAGSIDALLAALTSQLEGVLNTVIGTLPNGAPAPTTIDGATIAATDTITGLVTQITTQLDTLTQGATAPVSDAINAVIAELAALPKLLAATLKANATDTSLLRVGLIESTQTVKRTAGVVTSTSGNKLVGISVLGGLVTVDGLTSQAQAKLGQGISEAIADKGQNAILKVNVDGLLTAEVTNGLNAVLGAPALPAAVVTAVNGALAQITSALNGVLGATLTQTAVGQDIETADRAASSVSAARLVVNPTLPGLNTPLFDKPLVDIQFVPATAEVLKAQSALPPSQIVRTQPVSTTQRAFAQTGAELPLTGAIAVTLMGLAVVARRRRMAHISE